MESTKVTTEYKKHFNFPKFCPISGEKADSTLAIKGSPVGFKGVPKYIMGDTPTIKFPINSNSKQSPFLNPIIRNVFNLLLVVLLIPIFYYFIGPNKLYLIGGLIAVMLPVIIWQVKHPLPVEFQAYKHDKIDFEFKDIKYAKEFAKLNDGEVEK